MSSTRECDLLLRSLRRCPTWNAHAKFLIVIDFMQANQAEFVAYIFSSFWQHFVINIVVLIATDESEKDFQVFISFLKSTFFSNIHVGFGLKQLLTWIPFEETNCGNHPERIVAVGICQDSHISPSTANVFVDKVDT